MTTSTIPTTDESVVKTAGRTRSVMPVAAGLALVAGPLLWSAGMFTSPPTEIFTDATYIASLAKDSTLTQVSALFLHYGNLLIALGILAAPGLVRGGRGLKMVVAGSLATALGFANVSGMILSDWWNYSTGTHLSSEQAVEIFRTVKESSMLWMWDGTEPFALVGPLLVFAGLARAGVLSWWTMALFVGGFAGLMALGSAAPLLAAVAVLVGFGPFAMVGLRLLQRSRITA